MYPFLLIKFADDGILYFRIMEKRKILMETQSERKVVLSAIQPTGTPTLGNYLGALKNWKEMAKSMTAFTR